ncbi:MAG: calcium/sodium antiporter [Cyanobacteria bacterium J06555_13]
MNIWTVVALIVGLVLLVGGADFLVKSASKLAATVGIPPLVIGLTVVAFGTSAPELAVSVQSVLSGQADISLGNVVGSNICNVLLILGLSAIIAPLAVAQQLIRLDVPIMVGVSALLLFFGLDGQLNRSDGVILFVGGLLYTLFLLYQSRKEKDPVVQEEYAQFGETSGSTQNIWTNVGLFAVGLAMLVAGSQLLINSAVAMATAMGASPLIIGLTVVAVGTSLPELATSVAASLRGESDIAVGNVVGSNIFNILVVLGVASSLSPTGISISPSALLFDIPIMLVVAVACLPIFFTGSRVCRREGGLLLGYYGLYVGYLIVSEIRPASPWVGGLGVVVALLTVLMIALVGWEAWQTMRNPTLRATKRTSDQDD